MVVIPHLPNKITVLKNQVFITGVGKAISFSRDGTFRNEFRTHQRILQLIPVRENFVAMEQIHIDRIEYVQINLYSNKLKKLKELYRQKWFRQGGEGNIKMDMGLDFIGFAIWDDKIYIEESPKGFFIEVFDHNGEKLRHIKKDYKKLSMGSAEREKCENRLRSDPAVQDVLKNVGGWNEFKKIVKFEFPDYFPAIKGIEISNNKIYVRTFISRGDKEKYIVMDLKGNELETTWISRDLEVGLMAQVAGGKLYSIAGGKLYYIKENFDTEEWELFAEPLK